MNALMLSRRVALRLWSWKKEKIRISRHRKGKTFWRHRQAGWGKGMEKGMRWGTWILQEGTWMLRENKESLVLFDKTPDVDYLKVGKAYSNP